MADPDATGAPPAKGHGRGPARAVLRLRLSPAGDFAAAYAALEREAAAGAPLAGAAVTLEAGARRLSAPDMRRIEQLLLDRHGAQVLQVVEGAGAADRRSPAPAGRRRDAALGAPATAGVADRSRGRRGPARSNAGSGRLSVRRAVPPRAPHVTRVAARRTDLRVAGRVAPAAPGRAGAAAAAAGPAAGGAAAGARGVAPPRSSAAGHVQPAVPPRLPPAADAPAGGVVQAPAAARGVVPAAAPGGPGPAVDTTPTMLIRRTLRSGQRVRFGGNVVVLGDVNPGAEIVAAGDIVVMGTLRGVAHAGAAGDQDAAIVAFRLLPTQIRVAAVIGRSPDGRVQRPDGPEVARVRDAALVVERYVPPT